MYSALPDHIPCTQGCRRPGPRWMVRPIVGASRPPTAAALGGWWQSFLRALKSKAVGRQAGAGRQAGTCRHLRQPWAGLARTPGGHGVAMPLCGRGSSWGLARAGLSSPVLVLVIGLPTGGCVRVAGAADAAEAAELRRSEGGSVHHEWRHIDQPGPDGWMVCGTTAEGLRKHLLPVLAVRWHRQPRLHCAAPSLVRRLPPESPREWKSAAPPPTRARDV